MKQESGNEVSNAESTYRAAGSRTPKTKSGNGERVEMGMMCSSRFVSRMSRDAGSVADRTHLPSCSH